MLVIKRETAQVCNITAVLIPCISDRRDIDMKQELPKNLL